MIYRLCRSHSTKKYVINYVLGKDLLYLRSSQSKALIFKRFFTCHVNVVNDLDKKDVSGDFPSVYSPVEVEKQWYDWWEKNDFFSSADMQDKKLFSMILPPPNVTGTLHLGHALTATVQDAISRWHHMNGHRVIWVPGTDHAGIATQVVVEKQLWAKEKLTRYDLGREEFVKEIIKWQMSKGSHIQQQLRHLGAMLDWSMEYFTLDKHQTAAVTEAFIQLFDEGLIYRKNFPVNWCCWLRSTISDIEVENRDIDGPTFLHIPGYEKPIEFGIMTNIAYKVCNRDEEIVVSTTRPETLLGDVAIAVHPDDSRYFHLHGCQLWHPYREERIPLICDPFVDAKFGTGAVKITPAHDKTDYDVSRKHNLKLVSVIDETGNIHNHFKIYGGIKRFTAREKIMNDLAAHGLLRNVHGHKMVIPICSRSGDVVELIPKAQWFLSMQEMSSKAQHAVVDGSLQLMPARMNKIWHQWFNQMQDWCLSRQLWWGHRVPAYECYLSSDIDKTVWVAARNIEEAQSKALKALSLQSSDPRLKIKQDDDVLDTWFSSSLLPFSAFGWPCQSEYQNFYPLTLMETGNDILFFWVARMVMLGQHFTKKLPFNQVLLHGVLCDAFGRKMSKSIGNVVSPEDVRDGKSLEDLLKQVEESHKSGTIQSYELKTAKESLHNLFPNGIPACGTDALRFTLCANDIQSQFIHFNIKECHSNRLFGNKIWQACRYVRNLIHSRIETTRRLENHRNFSVIDQWILSRLYVLTMLVDQGFKERNLQLCTSAIRNFMYDNFCDVFLESTKSVFKGDNIEAAERSLSILTLCVRTVLLTLSPFMPFLSEELYQRMGFLEENLQSVFQVSYPKPDQFKKWHNEKLEKSMELILLAVSAVRRLKQNNGFKNPEKISVIIQTNSSDELEILNSYMSELTSMGCCNIIQISRGHETIFIPFQEEQITDFSSIKIVLLDDHEKKLSNKAKEGIVLAAVHKKSRVSAEISKAHKFTESNYFKNKASAEYKDTHYLKLKNLQEELKKTEIILNLDPGLSHKIQEIVTKEKQIKVQRKHKRELGAVNENSEVR